MKPITLYAGPLLKMSLFARGWRNTRRKFHHPAAGDIELANGIYEDLSQSELQFLSVVTQSKGNLDRVTIQQKTYVEFIRSKIIDVRTEHLAELWFTEGGPVVDSSEVFFRLLADIVCCATSEDHFSIDGAIQYAQNAHTLVQDLHSNSRVDKARVLLFFLASFVTMLYIPVSLGETSWDCLKAVRDGEVDLDDDISISEADGLLSVLLHQLGSVLPGKFELERAHLEQTFAADSLHVHLLNASTLSGVGRLKFDWVNDISQHLILNQDTMTIKLFRLPSFCRVFAAKDSVFDRIANDYYDSLSKPPSFSGAAYLKEVRHSYQLLFADDSKSRSRFQRYEENRASQDNVLDPYLVELCSAPERGNFRRSYSKRKDFPLLAGRLSEIQDFVRRQNPTTLPMFWRDRRDGVQWYTFLVVAVLTIVGIVFGLVQIGLTAAQVHYVKHPPS